MCPPKYFSIDYAINPWMKGNAGRVDSDLAFVQWQNLADAITDAGGSVSFMEPVEGLPDQVFCANIAAVIENRGVISNFAYSERVPESSAAKPVLETEGFRVFDIESEFKIEGTGDLLRDFELPVVWAGYGHRTSLQAHLHAAQILDYEIVSLHLVNPRFYHLDVCLAPLPGGYLMFYPEAFDQDGLREINKRVPVEKQIVVSETDALNMACNAIPVGKSVLLYMASDELKEVLRSKGFEVIEVDLGQFILAGGSARCMVLPLVEPALTGGANKTSIAQDTLALEGHLLDFSVLSKCLDEITENGCEFEVVRFKPGHRHQDESKADIKIFAPNQQRLNTVIEKVQGIVSKNTLLLGNKAS